MSWLDAKAEAQRRIAALPLPAGDLTGYTITVTEYRDDSALTFEGVPGSLVWSHMVVKALWRLIKARGAFVEKRVITLSNIVRK